MPEEPYTAKKSAFVLTPSISILVAGVLVAGAILFVNLHPAKPVVADAGGLPTSVDIPAPTQSDYIVGSLTAPIVLVEYSDFQCPYCSMVYPTLKRIVSESGGKIAWVMRNFPLESIHPQAKPAAIAAECVAEQLGNDGFWKFADAIFSEQTKISPTYYAQVAAKLGADEKAFASCVSSEKPYPKIQAESLDAQKSGGNGTPYTIIVGNGLKVPISGALPYEQFISVINAVKARQ